MGSPERNIEQLLELGNLAERGTRSELFARALRTAILLMDADAATIVLTSARRRGERLVLYAGSATPAALQLPPDESEVLRGFADARQALSVPDLSDAPTLAESDACPGVEAGPVLFTPVAQRDPLPGYLAVYRKRGRARFNANETQAMLLLAAWLGTSVENLRLSAGTERLAITDDLTEIYNARFLKAALRREVRRANRFSQELSLVVIDVDQIDTFRETNGDLRTHVMLKELATLLAQQVRSFDVLGRYGDDGFMVVLPQTPREGAAEVAERMRAAVEARAFTPAEAGATTVTLGIASFPADGLDLDALLAVADRALEQGRQKGRNCVAMVKRKAA
ncbi:MAG: diguanylate cyclase [Candidatus Eiseniibacteriota bacterium]